MTRTRTRLIALAAALACAASAAADTTDADLGAARATRDYVFVFITTGPLRTPTPEQSQEAMRGHFANMQRLAAEGELLIAGPFGEPRSDPGHRGLFVFDETTLEGGLALARTDPAAEMGVFTMTAHLFTTDAPLTDLPRLEKEDEARRLADPDVPDEWQGRAYVLATAPYTEERFKAARNTDGVLIAGRLHGAGTDGGDLVLVWVDAEKADGVAERLPQDGWTLHGWYGSGTVARLEG